MSQSIVPPNLRLILDHPDTRRDQIRTKAIESVKAAFPIEGARHSIHLEEVTLQKADYTSADQKKAVMEGRSLSEPIKGVFVLKDKQTGQVLDRTRPMTVLDLPWFTDRHTMVVGGNEYSVANQLRLKPGIYTRRRGNEELETQFNVLKKGGNFALTMEPETGKLGIRFGGATTDLYPVLRGIGVPHADIAKHWGHELADVNASKSGKRIEAATEKLFKKITPEYKHGLATTHEARATAVREWFNTAKLDPNVVNATLGVSHDVVKPETLLRASQRLVNVYKNSEEVDDRDNLEFKRIHQVDDFIKERISLTARDLRKKVVHKMDHLNETPTVSKVLPTGAFTPAIRSFLTTSDVSTIPTSYNPVEVLDISQKVTPLGEGGIGDIRAVGNEARQIHPSHFGILDPIRTSESQAAGADVRAAIHTARDEEGNLYLNLANYKTGKVEYVPAHVASKMPIAFPGEKMHRDGHIDVVLNGAVTSMRAKDVTYKLPNVESMFSPATAMLPLIESMQGNRALMAAKMQTQALALKEKEVPLVQAQSQKANISAERLFGGMVVPKAPVSGTIEKVDGDYIYLRPYAVKTSAHADDRLEERTTLHPSVTERLRTIATKLEPNNKGYYLPLPFNQGNAAFKTVQDGDKKKVVLATILAPGMSAKGERLKATSYEKAAEDLDYLEKEAAEPSLIKVKYDSNYPMGAKSFLNSEVKVKPGDQVTEGQLLADSNFTKDGTLTLGKNLNVALMAYKGINSNDAIVISETAAKKLTSLHMYREKIDIDRHVVTGKEKHKTYYGNKYRALQYEKLDDDGCVKKGAKLDPGDILFATMMKSEMTPDAAILGKLHKSLVKPYRDTAQTWEHQFPGEVVDVYKTPTRWAITVKTEEPMQVGDKLSGRHGNKGVVSAIVPDNQMIKDGSGKSVDVLYTSAAVISRINPSQILEMAYGKVAQKTGKPIILPQFGGVSHVEEAKKLLKEHGLTDKETVEDPMTGRKIPGIMVGPMYMHKLMKTTSTNYSARGVSDYDVNQQPTRGGTEGAKGLGRMEFAGFIAHNARSILKEQSLIKSQKNDEFWHRLHLGLPPPPIKTTFAYDKFGNMLTGMGLKMDKNGNKIGLGPLTDKDVVAMSNGPITEPKFVRAKDLRPEEGGLFDVGLTGGMNGTKWTHIDLHEPIVNPIFHEPTRRLLGITGTELTKRLSENGTEAIKGQLKQIDIDKKLRELRDQTKTLRGANLDNAVKQIKYLEALKKQGLRPEDAFILSKLPVVPPAVRPILPSPRGDLLVNDANHLYRDLMLANDKLKMVKEEIGAPAYVTKARAHLNDAVKAVVGLGDPVSPQNASRNVKGFMELIAGTTSPKLGYFQNKLIKRQLDLSGRGTIVPDINLGMEEIGLPEEMMWTLFEPFIIGRLVRRGYEATRAKQMIKDHHPAAKEEMLREAKERPVIYNRAPSLHRYNLISAYPKPVDGQTVRIPATWSEPMMNADFDGDTMQIHTPVTREAVREAKSFTLPNLIFADKSKGQMFVVPQHEAVFGAYKATMDAPSNKKVTTFKDREDALGAWRRGEIGIHDPVEIKSK